MRQGIETVLALALVTSTAGRSAETKERMLSSQRPRAHKIRVCSMCSFHFLKSKPATQSRPFPVGTGQALALAAKGDPDVALVHAPSLEKQYVAEGKLFNRRLVMYKDFVIIGPKDDPARIRSMKSAANALKSIERSKSPFVSRGDNSGTHNLEKSLWKASGVEPKVLRISNPAKAWEQLSTWPTNATLIRSPIAELAWRWASG